jgi:hypothetical protein
MVTDHNTNTCRARDVWGCMAYKGVHSSYNAGMVIPAISDMYDHTCDYDMGMAIPDTYGHTCDYIHSCDLGHV